MSALRARIAPGSGGAGFLSRAYRRSPLRGLRKVYLDHRGLRASDVFLASYPRSGSVWLRFLVLEMCRRQASFVDVMRDVPYVGEHAAAASLLADGGRVIKTHEPYLAAYRRAIHLVRDPRDVCLSYFRFMQRNGRITLRPGDDEAASFDRFVDAFIAGRLDAHGTWEKHLLSWLDAARDGHCDVLLLRYEDLRADTPSAVERIADWLGTGLAAGDAERIADRCSIERMRDHERDAMSRTPQALPAVAIRSGVPLIGSGAVAGWRSRMTAGQVARFGEFARGMALVGYPTA